MRMFLSRTSQRSLSTRCMICTVCTLCRDSWGNFWKVIMKSAEVTAKRLEWRRVQRCRRPGCGGEFVSDLSKQKLQEKNGRCAGLQGEHLITSVMFTVKHLEQTTLSTVRNWSSPCKVLAAQKQNATVRGRYHLYITKNIPGEDELSSKGKVKVHG